MHLLIVWTRLLCKILGWRILLKTPFQMRLFMLPLKWELTILRGQNFCQKWVSHGLCLLAKRLLKKLEEFTKIWMWNLSILCRVRFVFLFREIAICVLFLLAKAEIEENVSSFAVCLSSYLIKKTIF